MKKPNTILYVITLIIIIIIFVKDKKVGIATINGFLAWLKIWEVFNKKNNNLK